MVAEQIAARGVKDARLLDAMRSVPREEFVELAHRSSAHADKALPLTKCQTISQPYMVAAMADALKLLPGDKVLEVGTGSGYAAAVLSKLAAKVFTVERHLSLHQSAAERLERLGFQNVWAKHADGTLGWPEHGPFDAITVAAGGAEVPEALRQQLAIGGRLIMPVGPRSSQSLVLVTRKTVTRFAQQYLGGVRFVPLLRGCVD